MGVLLLTVLPYRFFQMQFLDLLNTLENDAIHYGNLLTAVAMLMTGGLILSAYGRMVFIKACSDPPSSWRDLLRVNWRTLVVYIYLVLLLELVLIIFIFSVVGVPLVILIAGVAAAATTESLPPGVVAPLRALAPYLRSGSVLVGLLLVFAVGLIVAAPNVYFLFRLVLWAAEAIPGFDAMRWDVALTRGHPRFIMVVIAFTITIIEPFWLAAMQVYVDRVRARESGVDLKRRFLEVTSARARKLSAATTAFLLMILVAGSAAAQDSITMSRYIRELEAIRSDVSKGDITGAAARASSLKTANFVTTGSGRFKPDLSLLTQVEEAAAHPESATALYQRLSVTINALQERSDPASTSPVDPDALERLRQGEQVEELWRGGEVFQVPTRHSTVLEEVRDYLQRAIDWIADRLEKFFDALARLVPKTSKRVEEKREFYGLPFIVWMVTLLVVMTMLLMAVYVLRRSRKRLKPVVSQEAARSSASDADPLSRESNEWERYALELAAKGRIREAIRAWYHAVLVTLYGAGILHYRRGRTNWEYVRALSPNFGWRPRFVAMTRQFEIEWYGHREGTDEVLEETAAHARAILNSLRESQD